MDCLIYSGSFDPPTLGHLDIIRRAAGLCDHLIVAVMESGSKQPLFTLTERKSLLTLICEDLSTSCQIDIRIHRGLAVDLYRRVGAEGVVRGLRNSEDLRYELTMATINRQLNPEYETIFLPARPELTHISSSLVREIARYQDSYLQWIPEAARDYTKTVLQAKINNEAPQGSEEI